MLFIGTQRGNVVISAFSVTVKEAENAQQSQITPTPILLVVLLPNSRRITHWPEVSYMLFLL